MTAYELMSEVISAVALFGLLASVWVLRGQLRAMADQSAQLRKSIDMSAETALDGLFIPVLEAYLTYPELRRVFNEDEVDGPIGPISMNTELRANALAETLADAMERALNFADAGLPGSAVSLRSWIEDSFSNSCFFRSWLRTRSHWYAPSLVGILQDVETRLAE